MQKQGPCYHCGISSTPLWRNGPPEKSVLCNACGSRFRTKGTLDNYVPKHGRVAVSSEGAAREPGKSSIRKNTSSSYNDCSSISEDGADDNLSSDSEEITDLQGVCRHKDETDEGHNRQNAWKPPIPCRKRSFKNHRSPSPVELLKREFANTRDCEHISLSTEEEEEDILIYEKINIQIPDNEIGLGIVLLDPSTVPSTQKASEPPSSSLSDHQVAASDTASAETINQVVSGSTA